MIFPRFQKQSQGNYRPQYFGRLPRPLPTQLQGYRYDRYTQSGPGKANVVADALSRQSMDSLAHVEAEKIQLTREIHQLAYLGVRLIDSDDGGVVLQNTAKSSLIAEVKERQCEDPKLVELRERVPQQKKLLLELKRDGVLRHKGRLCVPDVAGLRYRIMSEAHYSWYFIHPRSTEMYHGIKDVYWWNDMKKNIDEFVAQCPSYQQVKAEHQKPGGLMQTIEIPMWKWEAINMDFVTGLTRSHRLHLKFQVGGTYNAVTSAISAKNTVLMPNVALATSLDHSDLIPLLYHCSTVVDAWTTLKIHFLHQSTAREMQYKHQLHTIKKGDLSKIQELADCLHSIGRNVNDSELVRCALNELPLSYDSFVIMASHMRPAPRFSELWTMLHTHEARTLPSPDLVSPTTTLVSTVTDHLSSASSGYRGRGHGRGGGHGRGSRLCSWQYFIVSL
ncbi:uncharacterized protein [Nicotiana tomentosiformis]|uniref:uncharacterized protein n=1 Tax=Nicotiana tomentosiformis TaxID=4098 RepID=UPI00388CCC0B